jgi:GntR family transcriptional regulator/MocR family aminotransferase
MDFHLPIDQKSGKPIHRQITDGIVQAIAEGRLKPSEKLPSTRDLAATLDCSRFTVMRSYEDLVSAGYIIIATGSGAFVSADLPANVTEQTASHLPLDESTVAGLGEAGLSSFGKRVIDAAEVEPATAELFAELNYGASSGDLVPAARWKEMVYKASRSTQVSIGGYENDPLGLFHLRQSLAGYLTRSRAVRCGPDRIAIFSGSSGGLDLVLRLLVEPGDLCVVEEPGFPGARRSLLIHGARLFNASVDHSGIMVDQLRQIKEPIKLVYVTPSYQDPTGAVMSIERRRELLALARERNFYIIEDDFSNEYRYGDKPLQAIQGLDEDDRVIYVACFWKVLFPLVRAGYLILPERLVDVTYKCKSLIERDYPLIEQTALADFIADGHLERHIKRTRPIYAKRRAALVQALTKGFGSSAKFLSAAAGTQMLVRFDDSFDHHAIISAALKLDVSLVGTEAYYSSVHPQNEFLMGFAHIAEDKIGQSIEALASELQAQAR